MFCRKCGNLIPDDSVFCNKCGTAVEKEDETALNSQLWIYNNAVKEFNNAQTIEELEKAESTFRKLGDYKNSAEYVQKCRENKLPLLYESTTALLKNAKSTQEFQTAEKNLKYLGNFKDSKQLLDRCQYDLKLSKYNDAYKISKLARTADEFLKAEKMFRELGDFEDAAQLADGCLESGREKRYFAAAEALKKAESNITLDAAAKEFEALGSYKDAAEKAAEARKGAVLLEKYNNASEKMQAAFALNPNSDNQFLEAESLFSSLGSFKNSFELAKICIYNANAIRYNRAFEKLLNVNSVADAESCRAEFAALGNFYMSQKMVFECDKVIHNFSVLDELKKLIVPLECSNDLDALQSARRKALSLDGAGNSAQLVEEFDRKIECVKANRPFRLAKLKSELTANVDFSKRAVLKTELDPEELSQMLNPSKDDFTENSAKSSAVNLEKQPQSSVNLDKQSQSSSVNLQKSPNSWEQLQSSSVNLQKSPQKSEQSSPRNSNPAQISSNAQNPASKAQNSQVCAFCHSKIPLGATECPNCGVNIEKYENKSAQNPAQTPTFHKYCKFCYAEVDINASQCPNCGEKKFSRFLPHGENNDYNDYNDYNYFGDDDGLKKFSTVAGVIYAVAVVVTIIILFASGNWLYDGSKDTLFSTDYGVQTIAGVIFGGLIIYGISCAIYKFTHKH